MAHVIAKGTQEAGAHIVLRQVEVISNQDLLDADGIVMGSPVYFGK